MADVHSAEVRSYNMSRIKGKDTKPELLIRKFLFANGCRYRLHVKNLPGKPDIVLPKYNTVIFVNGCFWHGHTSVSCNKTKIPETNTIFWQNKINANKERDLINQKQLKKLGWKLITIWECSLKGNNKERTFKKIIEKLVHNT